MDGKGRAMKAYLVIAMIALPLFPAWAETDIFDAAREGDVAAIEAYAKAGGEMDVRNTKEYTPFILAAYHGHEKAAAALLAAGADGCAADEKGSNAFMGVAFKGNADMAEWMLSHTKCDVNHQNYAGQTALMMASLFGQEEVVELLMEHGADPDIRDNRGNTAESLAQGQGLTHVIDIIRFHMQ